MNVDLDWLKEKFRSYKKEDIIFTDHAKLQALVRDIDLEEVKNNIINPKKLIYAEEQKAEKEDERKFNCYFTYSRKFCHRYILTVNRKIIIVTVISIRRDWQKIIEKRRLK